MIIKNNYIKYHSICFARIMKTIERARRREREERRQGEQEIERWNFLVSEMRFSPVSHHFAHTRHANSERLRPAGRFSKISSFGLHLLTSERTMIVYESTYKSRIVRLPMFSRPDINPTVERSCTRYCPMADPSRNRMTPTTYLSSYEPLVHS